MVKEQSRGPPKLPVKQLSILAIARFAEPVAMTSVFPYLPEMIESLGVDKKDVAKWAGLTSAAFSSSQCITAVFWGRASDKFGRKPMILIGLTMTMISSLVWGMSTSIPMAITARAMAGGFNGNVGIIRTMVAEMVPEKELQPRAFSIMPLIWSLGSIFGPTFGGFFANPAENIPALFGNSKFFIAYPFLLPNLVASVLFMVGITTGFFFLKETLETKRHRKDYGRELGKRLTYLFKTIFRLHPKPKYFRRPSGTYDESSAALLRPASATGSESSRFDDAYFAKKDAKPALPRPTMTEVFTRQSVINLLAYMFLALHSVSYDQLLPIFLHHPKQVPDELNTHLPFKFSGGFGLGSGRIGTLFTMYGFVGCFIQFLIFPPVARKYGVLYCFKGCGIAFPIVYLITPYVALIQDSATQQAAVFSIMVLKSAAVIFAFPCSTILLTNSATSLRILGTLNGFAVSTSAVGRAFGPAMCGAAFTWGLEKGYIITSFWLLSFIGIIGAIPIWYLVEMPGFSKTDDSDSDEEDEEEEEEDLFPVIAEDANGEILEGDEVLAYDENEEALDVVDEPSLYRVASGTRRRKSSASTEGFLGVPSSYGTMSSVRKSSRRNSITQLERRMTSPIGMRGGSVGPGGGRRLSNGLAASNMGQGTGGTIFA